MFCLSGLMETGQNPGPNVVADNQVTPRKGISKGSIILILALIVIILSFVHLYLNGGSGLTPNNTSTAAVSTAGTTAPSGTTLTLQFSNLANYDNGPSLTLFNGGKFTFITSSDTASVTLSNGTVIDFGQIPSTCSGCPSGTYGYSENWNSGEIIDGFEFSGISFTNINGGPKAYVSFRYPSSGPGYAYSANYSST